MSNDGAPEKNAPLQSTKEEHLKGGSLLSKGDLNIEDVKRFFKLISPTRWETETFCVCWMDEGSENPIPGYGTCYRTVEDIIGEYGRFNFGYLPELHCTLNRTNHKGRRNENIESSRVLCLDLDNETSVEAIKEFKDSYLPHMVVESSPGKYHCYWRITGIGLKQWSTYQLGLAQLFEGDPQVSTISKTIRVPGVPRVTKKDIPFVPRVVYFDEEAPALTEVQIEEFFPDIVEKASETRKKDVAKSKALTKAIGKIEVPEGVALNGHSGNASGEINESIRELVLKNYTSDYLAHTGHGRNSFLYAAVLSFVRTHTELTEIEDFEFFARTVNENFPEGALDDAEFNKTLLSAFNKGMEQRAEKEEREESRREEIKKNLDAIEDHRQAVGIFEYDYTAPRLRQSKWSEMSIVGRILQRYSGHIVRASKTIYAFDTSEKVWRPQRVSKEILTAYALSCVEDLLTHPDFITEECTNEKTGEISLTKISKLKKSYLSNSCMQAVISQVINSDEIPRKELTDFDSKDHLLYCANGVLDMITGDLREACSEDYLLQRTSISYDPTAKCDQWIEFINEVYAHNEQPQEVVKFLKRMFGYSLSGGVEAQKIFIHYGESCNGKSKILAALATIGGSYTAKLDGSNLANKGNALQKEFERIGVKVEGKRVVIIDDLDSKTEWNEGHVKSLTDSTIIARKLYEEERDIPNHATFHIACNEPPKPTSDNTAVMRRMCIIPYPRRFAQDSTKEIWILDMLKREAAGILRWAIEGYREYKKNGELGYPEEVQESLEAYRSAHLTDDDAVLQAISKVGVVIKNGEGDETEERDWHTLGEITKRVEEELKSTGKNTNEMAVGRLLGQLQAGKFRKRTDKGRLRFYNIQLFDEKTTKLL